MTKWLIRLEKEGVVVGAKEHVPGHRVRRTVYRLTEKGLEETRQLRSRLESELVEVRLRGLDPAVMRVAGIPKLFPGVLDLGSVVSRIRRGTLDLTSAEEVPTGRLGPVVWGDAFPTIDRFFGRAAELNALDAWIASSAPAITVVGLAGIGKSALVASWVLSRQPRALVFWAELGESTTPNAFLRNFADSLARIGRPNLAAYLSRSEEADFAFALRLLGNELHALPILMVVDNLHRARADTLRLVTGQIRDIAENTQTKAVFISRTVPRSAARSEPRSSRLLRLEGLDLDASVALLRSKGLAAEIMTAIGIARSARGHPVLLALAAQLGTILSAEARQFLEGEVWRALSAHERRALQALSVFRRSVPLAALRSLPGVTESSLAALDRRDVVKRNLTGGIIVHDMIRDYSRDRMGERTRRRYHGEAAGYFLRSPEPTERLEALYHLIEAGRKTEAARFLASEAVSILDSVSAEEVELLLRGLDTASLDALSACVLEEARGDCLRILGHVKPALQQYSHAIRRCEAGRQPQIVPRLLRKIAGIERGRNEHAKALGYLVEAQARLTQHVDPGEMAEVLKEMALVEHAQGRLDSASQHLNQAVDFATEASDAGSLARGLLVLGMFEEQQGHLERGLEHKQEALRIALRSGILTEAARAYVSVGANLRELRRFFEAIGYHEKGLQLAGLIGNFRLVAYATMNRGATMVDAGRFDEAAASLQEARRMFQILEERDALAVLELSEGQREMRVGHWSRATRQWDHALRILREIGNPYDLVRALKEVGDYHLEHGDSMGARAYLKEARAVAMNLANALMVNDIDAQLERHPSPMLSR